MMRAQEVYAVSGKAHLTKALTGAAVLLVSVIAHAQPSPTATPTNTPPPGTPIQVVDVYRPRATKVDPPPTVGVQAPAPIVVNP